MKIDIKIIKDRDWVILKDETYFYIAEARLSSHTLRSSGLSFFLTGIESEIDYEDLKNENLIIVKILNKNELLYN